jgi:hypothetical protein
VLNKEAFEKRARISRGNAEAYGSWESVPFGDASTSADAADRARLPNE